MQDLLNEKECTDCKADFASYLVNIIVFNLIFLSLYLLLVVIEKGDRGRTVRAGAPRDFAACPQLKIGLALALGQIFHIRLGKFEKSIVCPDISSGE